MKRLTVVKRDKDGRPAEYEIDNQDGAQRDEQARLIGLHVGHAVGAVVSDAIQGIDARDEFRRFVGEQQEAARPQAPTLDDIQAYNFARRKKSDADWDATMQRMNELRERILKPFSWEHQQ
jgi:hypothetical protein